MSKMKYISGPCGSGKSKYVKNEIARKPTKNYLIVLPTLILADAFAEDMKWHSNIQVRTSKTNPTNLLASINQVLTNTGSTVLLITDKMFYKIEPQRLIDWKIFIDDCVNFCEVRSIAKSQKDSIEKVYQRMFITGDYIEVDANVSLNTGDNALYRTYTLCSKECVSYDLQDAWGRYAEMENYHVKGIYEKSLDPDFDQMIVYGYYDLNRYVGLDLDITYMANNFEQTLIYKFWKYDFIQVPFDKTWREDNNQRLIVNYFYKNVGEDKFGLSKNAIINNKDGNLIKMQMYLNSILQDTKFYWTKNSDPRIEFYLNGDFITPNQRGINTLMSYDTCVFMAAMNPSNTVLPHYETLWGFTYSDIKNQWEYETFYQFVYRGVIRDQTKDDVMNVYVYDEITAYTITGATYNYIDLDLAGRGKAGRAVGSTKYENENKKLDARFRSWKKDYSTKPDAKKRFFKWRDKQELLAVKEGQDWLGQLDRYQQSLEY